MSLREDLQAAQYWVPYHYLPRLYHWHHLLEYELQLGYVVDWVQRLRGASHLDVGCGDGRLLKELGFGDGVDLDANAIAWARGAGVDARCMDVADVDGRYDIVTAIEVLEHIPDGQQLTFLRALAAKCCGKLLLTVPTINALVPAKHYRHYTEPMLRELVGEVFHIEHVEWIIAQPKWWSVLEMVPMKRHEQWLRKQLEKRLHATPRTGRHLLLVGRPR